MYYRLSDPARQLSRRLLFSSSVSSFKERVEHFKRIRRPA